MLIKNFEGQIDLGQTCQSHHKYDKWCTMTSSLIVFDHKSVYLTVTEIWPIFDFTSQGHHKCDKWCTINDIICVILPTSLYL